MNILHTRTFPSYSIMLFVGTLLLGGCCCNEKNVYKYIADEHRGWNPYKPGQQIIFESEKGELDTFRVKDYEHDTSRSARLECDKWEYTEKKECQLINNKWEEAYFYFGLTPDFFDVGIVESDIGERFDPVENKFKNAPANKGDEIYGEYFEQKNINGTTYTDVLLLKCGQDSCTYLKQFHYVKEKGLISFTTTDSIQWFKQ